LPCEADVIYIATVHWHDDRWLEPQRRYLERNLETPFRVYAQLEGIEDAKARVDVVADLELDADLPPVSHAARLNALAELIADEADDKDFLLFLDGDAFPIAPLDEFLERMLARYPLAAVRRDENLGDEQPHPLFCATTVGFWQEVGGDWRGGTDWTWTNALGWTVNDTGGKLLSTLTEKQVDWYPLKRTNRHNLHPVLFGLYDDLVYHHGAAFHAAFDRVDRAQVGLWPSVPPDLLHEPSSPAGRLRWKLRAKLWYLAKKRPVVKRERLRMRENRELSERVFGWLQEDEDFWLEV
jgi:hypothetical protein